MQIKKSDLIIFRNEHRVPAQKPLFKAGQEMMYRWGLRRPMPQKEEPPSFASNHLPTKIVRPHKGMQLLVNKRLQETGFTVERDRNPRPLKVRGHTYANVDQMTGIVTEIHEEFHPDFDMIKIVQQSGGVRYCYRYVLETVMKRAGV